MMDARVETEFAADFEGQIQVPIEELEPSIPDYMTKHYWWAYVHPRALRIFDHVLIVQAILWGNYNRLKQLALDEIKPGSRVIQTACVYGDFSANLAEKIGPAGSLDVIDIVPAQVESCKRKLKAHPWARVRLGDASKPVPHEAGTYDQACCFFLLHEVPDDLKGPVVDALLARLHPGGKAVFVDYFRAARLHPLRPIMAFVFRYLEPFAATLGREEISSFARERDAFEWTKETLFGGLYQKVTALRKP